MVSDLAGTLLVGRYRLGRRVGGGGMGAVHEARDERVGRRVAVKVLHPQLAREEQHVIRFLREAKAAAGLLHPHIVQVLDVSGATPDGPPFLVMEFLTGQSLSRLLDDERKLAPGRVVRLARQILSALSAAHAVGIVHRDMKPGNIIVQRGYDGREIAKIVDFGIAKLMDTRSYTRLTATGEILGTPAFMSPEQLTGGSIDHRADLYGVASIIYNCVAGEPAAGVGSMADVAQRALTGDHLPLAQRVDVHPELSLIVERGLALEPEERFADAVQMSHALAPHEDPTDALLIPEHRLGPPATRATPSVRPQGAAMPIPQTSERPPERAIPKTDERPPERAIPKTDERPPGRAIPETAEILPERARKSKQSSRGKGLVLAALAFLGSLLGAGVVAAYVVFFRSPTTPGPAVPAAEGSLSPVPAPPSGSTTMLPMMPSAEPIVPIAAAVTPDAAEPDAGSSAEE